MKYEAKSGTELLRDQHRRNSNRQSAEGRVEITSWSLYLHMLNGFISISYIYEPKLDPPIYHGFIFNRGCKSW